MAADINIRKSILQYRNPDIFLDELSVIDTSSQSGDIQANDQKSGNVQKKYFGTVTPLIRINTEIISGIKYFKLDLTGFKPTLIFRFETIDERFISTSYPKDGDIVSIYIRPFGEMFKPIRMDFIINEVIAPFNGGPYTDYTPSTGKYQTYTIMAEVRIPKLYKHISKSFKGNSSDALLKISEDLNLGYASNETKTKDSMNWLSPNLDYQTLIRDIVNNAWLGEEDYFDCWIDQYYNINLVNLKKQFDDVNPGIDTMRVAYGADSFGDVFPGGGAPETYEVEFPLLLTNSTEFSKSPLFISDMSLEQNAGSINKDLGYFQKIQFYDSKLVSDKPKNKFVEYDVESVTNKNLGSRDTINKGRLGENVYKEEIKKTYVGTMYFDNVHENFQQASTQNILNRNDSYKIILRVKNRAWTPFLYRGQTFPVAIFSEGSTTASSSSTYNPVGKQNSSLANNPEKRNINAFLSGNYVVLGFTIEYDEQGIYQTMVLGKKQWALNPGLDSEPIALDPKIFDADFNDLAKNVSFTVQENTQILKSDIYNT
jgi:hypothetical protein